MGMYLDRPAEPIVIRHTKGFVLQFCSPLHQLTRPRRSVEEREVAVTMQLGVAGHGCMVVERMFDCSGMRDPCAKSISPCRLWFVVYGSRFTVYCLKGLAAENEPTGTHAFQRTTR